MSSNLDHVLYGRLNCTDDEKENNAYQFARTYKDNLDGFLNYMRESDFSVMTGYRESWDFIRQESHSLERHTNLGMKLRRTPEKITDGSLPADS